MSPPLDDTGELKMRQIEEAIERMKSDPRRPGHLDRMLLSVAIGAGAVVGVCLVILTFAADHFSVEPGRIVLTMAASGTCIAPVLTGMFGMNRAHRKRFEATMQKVSCLAGKLHTDSLTRGVELATGLEEVKVGLDLLAGQIARIEEKLVERGNLDPPTDAKDIAMRSFETGRRIGRKEAEG